ncbi:MAG: FtsX-like permease family protein [Amphritea sp.]
MTEKLNMAEAIRGIFTACDALLRHFRRHPGQGFFILIGMSLGIALLIGVTVVNDVARQSYKATQEALSRAIQFKLEPRYHRTHLTQQHYIELRRAGLDQSMPVVRGRLRLSDGSYLRLKGIDPMAYQPATKNNPEAKVQQEKKTKPAQFNLIKFVSPPYQILISESYARHKGLQAGDGFELATGEKLGPITLVEDRYNTGFAALVDITFAQQLLKLQQQLSYVALFQLDSAQQLWLENWLKDKPGLRLQETARASDASQLSQSFHLNLSAMGMLAFIVGLFISYNALHFSIMQRQLLVCRLRASGLSLTSIMLALAIELILWITLATITGTVIGVWLAKFLLPGVVLTLESLFRADITSTITFQWRWLWQALLLAIASGFMALGFPLLKLAKTPILLLQSRQHQVETGRGHIRQQTLTSLLLTFFCGALFLIPGSQLVSLILVACIMLAAALLLPGLLQLLLATIRRIINPQRSPLLDWILADASALLTRNNIALMAFLLALSANVGILTMVGSFRLTLTDYLQSRLNADIYLSLPSGQAEAITSWLKTRQDIRHITAYQYQRSRLNNYPGTVVALGNHPLNIATVKLQSGTADLWPAFFAGKSVLISESLAQKTATGIGDQLAVELDSRRLSLPVSGIYYDYGNPAGQVLIADTLLQRHAQPPIRGLRLYLHDKADLNGLLQALKEHFDLDDDNAVQQQKVFQLSLEMFEQTFQITYALNSLTLLVAAIGIFCALAAVGFAQQKQMATLKSLGLSQRQLLSSLLIQQLILAGATALLAIPVGLALSWLLIKQVNFYAFGWTMPMTLFYDSYLLMWVVGIAAIICSSLLPLWRLSRIPVMVAFREAI